MIVKFTDYGIYTIDVDYLKTLYSKDHNVYYVPEAYENKPFLGIVVIISKYRYFIPFTSSKSRHTTMKNTGQDYFLVTARMERTKIKKGTIYKDDLDNKKYVTHILAQLDLRKMIPVPKGVYHIIDFNNISDKFYKDLLTKEFEFFKNKYLDIVNKVERIYTKQKTTGEVRKYYCNYSLLEKVCDNFKEAYK